MSTAMIQPEFEVQSEPMLEAVHDPGQLYLHQGTLTVGRSVVNWNVVIPENRCYDGIGIMVPGYSGIGGSSVTPALAHAREGLAMAWYNPARYGEGTFYNNLLDAQSVHAATVKAVFSAIKDDRTILSKESPNNKSLDYDRHILIAHSMGGIGATRYTLGETGSTEAIFHKASCGFGHPKLGELAVSVPKGALGGLVHELIPSLRRGDIPVTRANGRQLFDYFRHVQAIAEAVSCLRDNVQTGTQQLMENGVYVEYEAYQFDSLVKPDIDTAKLVHSHRIMQQAGHLAPIHKAVAVARGSSRSVSSL